MPIYGVIRKSDGAEICAALAGQDMKHTTPRDLYLLSKEL